MKIWNSYGSEHSLNLIMIGRFKEEHEAEEFEDLISKVTKFLGDNPAIDVMNDRFDEKTRDFLGANNLFCLNPQQLGHFLFEVDIQRRGNQIHISSEDDVNAFITLLVHHGAKVEVFSAHDYPAE